MRSTRSSGYLATALVMLAACNSGRRAAESALSGADSAITAITPEASKVAPEQLGPLSARLTNARSALERDDYEAAVAGATAVRTMVQALRDSLPARQAALEHDLVVLSEAMPRNLAAIKARLDQADRTGRPLRGLDAERLDSVKQIYASATAEWPEVESMRAAGDVGAAFAKAIQLRNRVSEALLALGLAADERAWGNLQTRPR